MYRGITKFLEKFENLSKINFQDIEMNLISKNLNLKRNLSN